MILFFLAVLLMFVAINIYASQSHPQLLFDLVNKPEEHITLTFLDQIEKTKSYSQQKTYFTSVYGADFKTTVEKDQIKRNTEIEALKQALSKNSKSRDILLRLAILSYTNKDEAQAKSYYAQAKMIDPAVFVKELE